MTREQFAYLSPKLKLILLIVSITLIVILFFYWVDIWFDYTTNFPPWFLYIGFVTGGITILLPSYEDECNKFYNAFLDKERK